MYNLIATDLDGTLLLQGDTIGKFTRKVLTDLSSMGKQIVFATGRHHADVNSIIGDFDIPVHLITSNGARLTSACKNLDISRHLPSHVVKRVIEETQADQDLVINMYYGSQWLTSELHHSFNDFNQNDNFNPAVRQADEMSCDAVEKIFFIHKKRDHDALVKLERHLIDLFSDHVSVAFSFPWCLEVMDRGVSKGQALIQLAGFLDIPINKTIAFGDGMNDVEMLSTVAKGVIMGTAHNRVKQALPYADIIGSCCEESVAYYLSEHVCQVK
ncbi:MULTISPECIES: Cof-type HAD-IIB family hydrolase [unclassified Photorhabdus]|uniref:Cof-type HAD-IIB family hydrolase n=1 Tax=unclassified Photorhabdus TaxID=2620880 RepID=UPI000DCE5BF2|nr:MULTISPECIES: Cof-type HAD-IIB family hydrolase [unclassified Photorhabdus]RAX03172.1 haloacid dehalogenase [Photorhabdus sp. S9-53]RAX03356.1 haloacid dehalogenase [Photorhabdus sp. S10-54]RAX05762.1 haloacid dehalogenase [Photorhabdus sp. S8-52]